MSVPKIEARLEYATRKKERRAKEPKPSSWQDKLDPVTAVAEQAREQLSQDIEKHLFVTLPSASMLQPPPLLGTNTQLLEAEVARLKRALAAERLNTLRALRAAAAETVKRLDLEIEAAMEKKQ